MDSKMFFLQRSNIKWIQKCFSCNDNLSTDKRLLGELVINIEDKRLLGELVIN
jgi:hypothetical protein